MSHKNIQIRFEKNKLILLLNSKKEIFPARLLLFQNALLEIADVLLFLVERLCVFLQSQSSLLPALVVVIASSIQVLSKFFQYKFSGQDNWDEPGQYHKTDNPLVHQSPIHKPENNKLIQIYATR